MDFLVEVLKEPSIIKFVILVTAIVVIIVLLVPLFFYFKFIGGQLKNGKPESEYAEEFRAKVITALTADKEKLDQYQREINRFDREFERINQELKPIVKELIEVSVLLKERDIHDK